MATKDWKKIKSNNPYKTHVWQNKSKGLLLEIHYDIGFGKQRNVSIYDYKTQTLMGFKHIQTSHQETEKGALRFAKAYMRKH